MFDNAIVLFHQIPTNFFAAYKVKEFKVFGNCKNIIKTVGVVETLERNSAIPEI